MPQHSPTKETSPKESLSRRRFLASSGAMLAAMSIPGTILGAAPVASAKGVDTAKSGTWSGYEVQPLDFPHAALEPYIDTQTMEIHHGRHYTGYVNNLNNTLKQAAFTPPATLSELCGQIASLPDNMRTTVRNNAGGAFNHELFWATLAPNGKGGGSDPAGHLGLAIEHAFGSISQFREAFAKAATSVFGSGWAWLCVDDTGSLFITTTPNQDNPLMTGLVAHTGKPILGLDVWEHSYYLHFQNRRADYIKSWWNVVNWSAAEEQFETSIH